LVAVIGKCGDAQVVRDVDVGAHGAEEQLGRDGVGRIG